MTHVDTRFQTLLGWNVENNEKPSWYSDRNSNRIHPEAFHLHRPIVLALLLSSRLLSKNLKIKLYRTIILSVVLYGCETWSLTRREERKLGVFENMVLRRIFGPRRDEVTGE